MLLMDRAQMIPLSLSHSPSHADATLLLVGLSQSDFILLSSDLLHLRLSMTLHSLMQMGLTTTAFRLFCFELLLPAVDLTLLGLFPVLQRSIHSESLIPVFGLACPGVLPVVLNFIQLGASLLPQSFICLKVALLAYGIARIEMLVTAPDSASTRFSLFFQDFAKSSLLLITFGMVCLESSTAVLNFFHVVSLLMLHALVCSKLLLPVYGLT